MIRLATFAVVLLAGLLTLGAFFLARGSGEAPVAETPQAVVEPDAPAEEAPESLLYFLADIDFTQGDITVVLHDTLTNQGPLVVRDQAALSAAKDTVYVNNGPTGGEVVGMVLMAMMGVPPEDTVAELYRDDRLIAVVTCTSTTCGSLAGERDMNLAPLLDAAQPLVAETSFADNYDDHLADFDAITTSPDYMFLDKRPETDTPAPRQTARMELYLPTNLTLPNLPLDPNISAALARTAVEPFLPDGARITGVTFERLGAGVVADLDSGMPTLAGGAPIPFTGIEFTNLRISIEGAATLGDAALDALSDERMATVTFQNELDTFVRDRFQSTCGDCFTVIANGTQYDAATVTLSEPEGYRLEYYDLREAP